MKTRSPKVLRAAARGEAERRDRSVIRLERPPAPNKRRRAARRQTGRDKRPLRGEYTRSPQVGGTPEAGLIAKWAGRIFIVGVCARVCRYIYINVCDRGKKFLSVGSNGRWKINSPLVTHADFIYVEICWKRFLSYNCEKKRNKHFANLFVFLLYYKGICYYLLSNLLFMQMYLIVVRSSQRIRGYKKMFKL